MDNKILAVGVFLLDRPNKAESISNSLRKTQNWDLELRWAAIGHGEVPSALSDFTTHTAGYKPKFELINWLLESFNLNEYRYILVTDDDIDLPENFLDTYLRIQEKYNFHLAQPARTHDSFIDHKFVAQLLGIEARLTRFVEIGPFFSLERQVFSRLIPFDLAAPMGWGLDFVWPVILEHVNARLGIVDATPVRHLMRKPVTCYNYDSTFTLMQDYLNCHPHLPMDKAFCAIESFPSPSLSG